MVASQLRANAREILTGKWGKTALFTLCYFLIHFAITFFLSLIPIIGFIANIIISIPISFGFSVCFMRLKRGEDIHYTDFFNVGFSNFTKVWKVCGNVALKMLVPLLLVVVFCIIYLVGMTGSIFNIFNDSINYTVSAGFGGLAIIGLIGYLASLIYLIPKGYLYALSYYVLYDNPDKSGKEIVEISESLMKGNRWNLFWLCLTFIGWAILSILTLYIGTLWLVPYMMVSFVCFYESLTEKTTVTPNTDINSNDDNPIQYL